MKVQALGASAELTLPYKSQIYRTLKNSPEGGKPERGSVHHGCDSRDTLPFNARVRIIQGLED